ncbi:hypothetical protein L1787_25220 [Acuticoccus sp. M5D2P5]|uniref:hypothetical protein n=1 Tax=Acuticoccus kalidii TaxID=2910977 RepID=UPI001F1C959F|nr:hypothetical protein [Acuticoccus kalidii]MCF3936697.1 hypothetical protein [Acuticoccus kalidii]
MDERSQGRNGADEGGFSEKTDGGLPMDPKPPVYDADDARQGEVILKSRGRRSVFIAGMIGIALIALIIIIVSLR